MRKVEEIVINGRNLAEILSEHKLWLSEPAGEETHNMADLREANLREANLREADLSRANLREADLSRADFSEANLSYANLSGANLSRADLRGANLSVANLREANLRRADFSGANLSYADLREADLSRADLSYANLSRADLSYANLSGADFSEANLSYANLSGANLSQSKGLLNPSKWMADNFDRDDLGYIVYKRIGKTEYNHPESWKIEPGSFIEEVVNPLHTVACACGVNFGTLTWVNENYKDSAIWKCRIRWMDCVGVVVPYNTDGKARCARLELVEELK